MLIEPVECMIQVIRGKEGEMEVTLAVGPVAVLPDGSESFVLPHERAGVVWSGARCMS